MKFWKEKTSLIPPALLLACVAGLTLADLESANGKPHEDGGATSKGTATPAILGAKLEQRVPQRREPPAPRLADIDEDGAIDRDEAESYYEALFSFLDGDDDGTVASDEFVQAFASEQADADEPQALREQLVRLFAILDADGDEKLTAAEFMDACDEHYGMIDTDGDGRVSIEEFRSRAL